jgi:hypothetical protein
LLLFEQFHALITIPRAWSHFNCWGSPRNHWGLRRPSTGKAGGASPAAPPPSTLRFRSLWGSAPRSNVQMSLPSFSP